MRIGWRIAWFIACLLGWCSQALAAAMLNAPALEYSQDGVNYQSFDAIVGRSKIGTYYDYHDKSGHPAFGTQRGTVAGVGPADVERRGKRRRPSQNRQ